MAETFLQVAPDGAGQKIAAQEVTRGADDVLRQEIVLSDPATDDAVVSVLDADPAEDAYALPVRLVDHVPEVTATGTIDALDETVTLEIKGRRQVGIYIASGALTADMDLMVEHSADGGSTWGEDLFWNGDAMVVVDILPHPQKDRRYYSILITPSYTHVRVRANDYTSGSVVVEFVANDQENHTLQSPLLVLQEGPTALGALNAAIQILGYRETPAFFVEAGNLAGTLVVEGHPRMQGTSGWVSVLSMMNGAWRIGGYAVSSPATGFSVEPMVTQAYARYRLRVSAYTSGSCNAHGRVGGTAATALSLLARSIPALTAPPFANQMGGVDSGGLLRAAAMSNTHPTGSEYAVLVRDRTPPVYTINIPAQVHVASADTVHWDLFNADATLVVRVLSILQLPDIFNAVTGIVLNWLLERTTAVGTGGSTLTPWLADLSQAALDADITARSKPTGGATAGTDLRNYILNADETIGGLELLPPALRHPQGQGIVLRQNQGLRCVQQTSSNQGNTGWLISFTATT
jgi:hypothetical protein